MCIGDIMKNTDDLRIVQWFKNAQKIVKDNPDWLVVCSMKEFVNYVNSKQSLPFRISTTYLNQMLSYNPQTSSLPVETYEKFGYELCEWWQNCKLEQGMAIYQKMMSNPTCWNREDTVLTKRFGHKWWKTEVQKVDATVDAKVDTTIKISFTEKK